VLHVPNELSPGDPNRRALERLLAPGDTFIDVGANHGAFSLVAARAIGTGGRVVAVEPQTDLARLIGRSLASSAACAFDVHGEACGDAEGPATLFVPRFNSGEAGLLASLSGRGRHDQVVVPVRTLDSLVGGTSLPGDVLIKIDVEGNEVAVLLGAQHLIASRRPRLLIELNEPALAASGRRPSDLVELLRGLGFARFAELDRLSEPQPLEGLRFEPSRNVMVAR
jgi:FkbM family methyltransferase